MYLFSDRKIRNSLCLHVKSMHLLFFRCLFFLIQIFSHNLFQDFLKHRRKHLCMFNKNEQSPLSRKKEKSTVIVLIVTSPSSKVFSSSITSCVCMLTLAAQGNQFNILKPTITVHQYQPICVHDLGKKLGK